VIWHVQRKRNQEKREKRKSTKNSNREQQTEERNIERSIENRGRKIHGDKLEKSDVATATRALRENALEARKPARCGARPETGIGLRADRLIGFKRLG